jgi:hypothetical protein
MDRLTHIPIAAGTGLSVRSRKAFNRFVARAVQHSIRHLN